MIRTNFKRMGRFFSTRSSTLEPARSAESADTMTSSDYWTRVNVTEHHQFKSVEDSLDYFHWRNSMYFGYIGHMPVSGLDDRVILDYGCGPGHDVIGFGTYSRPERLIAMDVSPTSLSETKSRTALHHIDADIRLIKEDETRLPLDDSSVDYIHSSGVIHHTPDPVSILNEFRRILKDDGEIRIMVYNYNSIYLHLYTAYIVQIAEQRHSHLPIRQAFRHLTDGEQCPISNLYTRDEFLGLAQAAGLHGELLGCSVTKWELEWLARRLEAIENRTLGREHRDFLTGLTFDSQLLPMHGAVHAGLGGCYRFRKS